MKKFDEQLRNLNPTSDSIINMVSESKEEHEFLTKFKAQIKNEILKELDKNIETFKHFLR